eukprot:gene4502-4405_t
MLREVLMARLHDARCHRLVLITGSAGFGKTTLMTQWRLELLKAGEVVSWLSLNAEDDAPETFCAGLITALQKIGLALEDDLLLLEPGDNDWLQAICAALINSLDRKGAEQYLMIDDFHHISSPIILALVQALVDNAPANFHLILASRLASPLLLGRLRAIGELCEIESSELTFAFCESYHFLKSHLDAAIDLDAAHVIHDLTNGWPIGLQLLSISMKVKPGKQPRQQLLSSANLGAYLSEDVISDLPDALFEFMQKLSILRRFNTELAAHVCEIDNAAELIATLEARNLFLFAVDLQERYQWYRWHPMFAEFLGQRLAESQIDASRLHLRAAEWFNHEKLYPEAIRHALVSEDFNSVVQIIQSAVPTTSSLSHLGMFMRWIDQVPADLLERHPQLVEFNAPGARFLQTHDSEMALLNRAGIVNVAWLEGNMLEAERSCASILATAEAGYGRRSLSASTMATVMGAVLYEIDRIDDARETLANRLNVLHFSLPEYMYCATLTQARLQCLQDSAQAALDYLVTQEAHLRNMGRDHGIALMLAEQVRITLMTSDWRHAHSLQTTLDDLARIPQSSESRQLIIQSTAALSRARLSLARQQAEQALADLEQVHAIGQQLNRGVLLVKADILKAFALDALGRDDEACCNLGTAIASGYRLGLMRTFLDEGEALHQLLLKLEKQTNKEVEQYRQKLLSHLTKAMTTISAKSSENNTAHAQTLKLTKREQEILALVEQSMSNKRIALALDISVQTVKWNLKNIFIKLSVSSRYEAIIAARKIMS